jgi:hypothetical protein
VATHDVCFNQVLFSNEHSGFSYVLPVSLPEQKIAHVANHQLLIVEINIVGGI